MHTIILTRRGGYLALETEGIVWTLCQLTKAGRLKPIEEHSNKFAIVARLLTEGLLWSCQVEDRKEAIEKLRSIDQLKKDNCI